jgi:hypothetical protein
MAAKYELDCAFSFIYIAQELQHNEALLLSSSTLVVMQQLQHLLCSQSSVLQGWLAHMMSHPKLTQSLPSLQVTSLANGVRIATEEGSGELASLSIAVESGTRFETAGINGTSALLKELAFAGQANKVIKSYFSKLHSSKCFVQAQHCLRCNAILPKRHALATLPATSVLSARTLS